VGRGGSWTFIFGLAFVRICSKLWEVVMNSQVLHSFYLDGFPKAVYENLYLNFTGQLLDFFASTCFYKMNALTNV